MWNIVVNYYYLLVYEIFFTDGFLGDPVRTGCSSLGIGTSFLFHGTGHPITPPTRPLGFQHQGFSTKLLAACMLHTGELGSSHH